MTGVFTGRRLPFLQWDSPEVIPPRDFVAIPNAFSHVAVLSPTAPGTCLGHILCHFKIILSSFPLSCNFFQGLEPSAISQNPQYLVDCVAATVPCSK